jgi:predicted heme/steroid binding protein
MKTFTSQELKHFDGKEGRPAYIGFMGKVYDVTESFRWQNGEHEALHPAGTDMSEALKKAPHGAGLLGKFKVVGDLI